MLVGHGEARNSGDVSCGTWDPCHDLENRDNHEIHEWSHLEIPWWTSFVGVLIGMGASLRGNLRGRGGRLLNTPQTSFDA